MTSLELAKVATFFLHFCEILGHRYRGQMFVSIFGHAMFEAVAKQVSPLSNATANRVRTFIMISPPPVPMGYLL